MYARKPFEFHVMAGAPHHAGAQTNTNAKTVWGLAAPGFVCQHGGIRRAVVPVAETLDTCIHTHQNAFCGEQRNALLDLSMHRNYRNAYHNETSRSDLAEWARPVSH